MNYETTEDDLSALLSEAGEITDIFLPADRATGRPRGFAFVEFSKEYEANAAIAKFNDFELGGRRLKINLAEDRPQRPGGGRQFREPMAPPDPHMFNSKGKPFKNKGSRRGLRRRKRSL